MISVYITSFNKDKYLSQAIISVLNQSLAPKEIIIVDDCSTDNSRNIIEKFASQYPYIIEPIYNENNLGVTRSRNIALSHCTGEIITYLDGDDTRTITGQVVDADDACVFLMESGKEISLTYDQIKSAKVKISIN